MVGTLRHSIEFLKVEGVYDDINGRVPALVSKGTRYCNVTYGQVGRELQEDHSEIVSSITVVLRNPVFNENISKLSDYILRYRDEDFKIDSYQLNEKRELITIIAYQ